MERTSEASQRRLVAEFTSRPGRCIASLAATTGLLTVPSIAGASTREPLRLAPALTAAVCKGVSAATVSSVVGWTVPAPTPKTTSGIWNKSLSITGTTVTCLYGAAQPTSITELEQRVEYSYSALTVAPPVGAVVAAIKARFKKEQTALPPTATFKYHLDTKSSPKKLYAQISASVDGQTFTGEFLFAWEGTQIAGVIVSSDLPLPKLAALEKLAVSNFGV
jgi:hypothetical protein